MSVRIGFVIGSPSYVLVNEEHDGEVTEAKIDPKQFLADTGLGLYFYQLKPDFARILKNDAAKARRAANRGKAKREAQP